MKQAERAAAKREAEMTEALGHHEYFSRKAAAIKTAQKLMDADLKLCENEIKRWEGRIAQMGSKAGVVPVAEGVLPGLQRPEKRADRGRKGKA